MDKYTPCKYCGLQPKIALQKAKCTGCGAVTRSFVNTGGNCQTEDVYAMFAWECGEYKVQERNDR